MNKKSIHRAKYKKPDQKNKTTATRRRLFFYARKINVIEVYEKSLHCAPRPPQ